MTKVLVVDDDKRIAKSLAVRLGSAGYEVTLVHDGVSAVSTARDEEPNFIILDICMPAGNGFSVVEKLQAMDCCMSTPIVFLTASRRPDLRERAEKLGAVGFFEKPYEFQEILNVIKKHEASSPLCE